MNTVFNILMATVMSTIALLVIAFCITGILYMAKEAKEAWKELIGGQK